MTMQRVNIHLTSEQRTKLRRLARITGLKPAEHIRRAIDEYVLKMLKRRVR